MVLVILMYEILIHHGFFVPRFRFFSIQQNVSMHFQTASGFDFVCIVVTFWVSVRQKKTQKTLT